LSSNSTIQVIERAADILAQFTLEDPVLGITEISRRTLLNKGTVYRILLTLESLGYVRRDSVANRYRLGFELFRLGSLVQAGMDFRREAMPVMRKLYEACGETVNLNVVHEKQRVCIECIESSKEVRIFARVGMAAPLTRGASGKVLLAFLPEAQIKAITQDLLKSESEVLFRNLKTIREQSYAVSKNERVQGALSISAPIFSHSGGVIAGLTVSGPVERFSEAAIEKNISLVARAAREISNKMGAKYPALNLADTV
jgi:IclR family transcriptional regulator, KDG regulon repressor